MRDMDRRKVLLSPGRKARCSSSSSARALWTRKSEIWSFSVRSDCRAEEKEGRKGGKRGHVQRAAAGGREPSRSLRIPHPNPNPSGKSTLGACARVPQESTPVEEGDQPRTVRPLQSPRPLRGSGVASEVPWRGPLGRRPITWAQKGRCPSGRISE